MMMRLSIGLAIAFAALVAAVSPATAQQTPPAPASAPLTVMTFNIRYGTANDGENHWAKRRELLFEVLRTADADLVGLQEALRFQIDEILAAVPGYGVVGVGRDDGRAAGEMSAILFRTSRFHVAESGTFWFSDTPETPGSKSWGNRITRISSWARFIDRDGRGFYHFNLHLDHESQPSREKSTALLLQRIGARRAGEEPVVVTGDFNVGEGNPALRTLLGGQDPAAEPPPAFVDTFRLRHADDREVGTFTAFEIGKTSGDKIDYVLVMPGTAVLAADIVRTSRDGRYPSDHFPVVARVRLGTASR
jgi:endonuclease/exonuclease/phosphatase family metal-dependent hydrolase